MISFDDNSSGGGDVDLSPIYQSLGAIKSNTHMIWDFVSTISNTTISYSTPYLETYRTENEMYMYNITGDLPIFSISDYKIINGIHSLTSKYFNNNLELRLDYLEEFSLNTFEKLSYFSLTGARMRLNSFDSCYANISARMLDDNSFLNGNVSVSAFQFYHVIDTCYNMFAGNNYVNVNCAEMSFGAFGMNMSINFNCGKLISATFANNKICNLNLGDVSLLTVDSVQLLNLIGDEISSFDCKNIIKVNIDAYQISNMIISNNSSLKINCVSFNSGNVIGNSKISINANTIENFTFLNNMLSISCLSGNSLRLNKIGSEDFIFASGLINTINNCEVYDGTMFLTGNIMTNCTIQKVNGHISFYDMDDCSFNSCSNLTIYAKTLKSVNFYKCSNVIIHGDLVHMPTLSMCDSIGLFYKEVQEDRIPMFYSCGVVSISDLKPTAGRGACYYLHWPGNWSDKLYIHENPLSQKQPPSEISNFGVVFDTFSSATGNLDSLIKINYAIWHANN